MTKLLRRMITMLLVVTCLVGTVAGCSNSSNNDNETKEEVTTKKAEVTTTEANTEEPTTENPVKTHEYKGWKLGVGYNFYNYEPLKNITLNPGDVLYANDFALKEGDEMGTFMQLIVNSVYVTYYFEKAQEFENEWTGIHGKGISYGDNFIFTYEGDKPMYFEFIGLLEEVAYFDVYPLE